MGLDVSKMPSDDPRQQRFWVPGDSLTDEAKMEDRIVIAEMRVDVGYIKRSVSELKEIIDLLVNKDELDRLNLAMERRLAEMEKRDAVREKQIERLEAFRYWILGAGAAIGSVSALIVELFMQGHK